MYIPTNCMSHNGDASDSAMKRRTLLRKGATAGAGSVALAAFGGQSAAARQGSGFESVRARELRRSEFHTPERARTAVAEYGADVLEELNERGFLQEASTDELPMEEFAEYGTGVIEGTKVFGMSASRSLSSDQITVVKEVGDTTIQINVRPQVGHAHAVIKGSDSVELVDPTGDLEPQECETITHCDCTSCEAGGYEGWREECCFTGGYNKDCTYLDSGCYCATC